jgi:hypothetical protein
LDLPAYFNDIVTQCFPFTAWISQEKRRFTIGTPNLNKLGKTYRPVQSPANSHRVQKFFAKNANQKTIFKYNFFLYFRNEKKNAAANLFNQKKLKTLFKIKVYKKQVLGATAFLAMLCSCQKISTHLHLN